MINNLISEIQKYTSSEEYNNSLEIVARFYQLNESEEGILSGRTELYLIGDLTNNQYIDDLVVWLDISVDKAKTIENKVRTEIMLPFKQKQAAMPAQSAAEPVPIVDAPSPIETLRQPATSPFTTHQSHPPLRVEEPMTKEHILSQIENPPRTVIKKYVIEHETHPPIKDPEHLIDNAVEQRAKLEAHYKD